MFSKLLFVIGVSAVAAEIRKNDVDTRYFITQFNGAEFPMTMGICNPLDVLGQYGYQRASCVTESAMVWRLYTDNACTEEVSETYFNSNQTQTGVGTYLDFDCSEDAVDAYASVKFSVGTCDTSTKVTFAAAVDTCTLDTDIGEADYEDYVSLNVYCNDNIAELQYYDWTGASQAVCTEDYLDQIRNATTECGYMLTTGGVSVYGQLLECVLDGEQGVPTGWENEPTDSPDEPENTNTMMNTNGETEESNEDGEDDSANVASFIIALIATIVATIAM